MELRIHSEPDRNQSKLTVWYAAVSSKTTSNFTKSRNATTKGGRKKV